MKLLLPCLVILIQTVNVFASDSFVITEKGVFFDSSESSWKLPIPASFTTCRNVFPAESVTSSSGGRGLLLSDCTIPNSPYSLQTLQTYQFSEQFWKPCKVIEKSSKTLKMICPRIYSERL